MYHVKLLEPIVNSRFFLAKRKLAMNKSRLIETEKKKESAVNSLYPLHQWSYFIFLPYFILPYPALLKLGRNDPGTKRLRVVTTHQMRSNQSVPKIMSNDPDRNDPGPKRPVRILWHGPIFLLNMRKLWQMKKHNCIHFIF